MAEAARWIDQLDPSDAELRAALPRSVHPRALEQLLEPIRHDDEPRPKLESHDEYVLGVFLVPVCVTAENLVYFQEIDLVATHETVVTVRKTPEHGSPFEPAALRQALEAAGSLPSGMIAYYVADQIAERFLDVVDALDDEVDELEDGIDTWPSPKIRTRISELRHDVLRIRRTLGPTRDALHQVVDRRIDIRAGDEIFPREIELNFADAYDKLLRAADGLELTRDLVAGARDYHQAKIANDQNEVMKKLTAIASILLVPTFIVGLYGQNFHHIPELGWSFGYWWSWGWILAATIGQIVYFRRKRWI